MRRLIALLAVLVPVLLLPRPALAASHPRLLDHVGSTTKVLVVTGRTWTSQRASLVLWQKSGGTWRAVHPGIGVWVGRNGFRPARARHEGDGTTPAGVFVMRYAFGSRANPGVHVGWKQLTSSSCWSGEPRDYNTYVRRTCTSRDENLWASRAVAYRYAAVVGFNDTPAVWGRGSGIFLHESVGIPTSGCVSMSEANVVWMLRWMTPGTKIAMGPLSYVNAL